MLESLTKEDWSNHLEKTFSINEILPQPLSLKLISVNGFGRPIAGNKEAYSLLFLGPLSPILPQMIYRLCCEGFGDLEIFLVPVGPESGGMQYEAVFT